MTKFICREPETPCVAGARMPPPSFTIALGVRYRKAFHSFSSHHHPLESRMMIPQMTSPRRKEMLSGQPFSTTSLRSAEDSDLCPSKPTLRRTVKRKGRMVSYTRSAHAKTHVSLRLRQLYTSVSSKLPTSTDVTSLQQPGGTGSRDTPTGPVAWRCAWAPRTPRRRPMTGG